ncbi:S8 family peptidase [Rhodanobacter sp. Col0626]|uniref:S8 family peptidase n=1 Tax=Rhodanobacter sp. Col0626 TaxID=3415679 RepID=UPI003CF0A634
MNSISHTLRRGVLAMALALALAGTAQAATQATINSSVMAASGSYDRFIVTYRHGSKEQRDHAAVVQNVAAALGRAGLVYRTTGAVNAPTTISYQRKLSIGAELVRTSRKLDLTEARALMQQLAADPAVAHVEPDVLMHALRDIRATGPAQAATDTPNDPLYAKYQWHFSNPAGGIDAPAAWQLADGNDVIVAVLDTGITHHPDLDLSLADDGYDFLSDALQSGRDSDGRMAGAWDTGDWTTTEPWLSACTDGSHPPSDSSWHGTHVSGTISELSNNGVGMAGVASRARVLPVRVLGHCGGYTSDIADAIVWASGGHVDGVPDNQHPAQVINMSLGGAGTCTADDVTGTAIADALSRNTTVVVAAGNENMDSGSSSPASCPGVISVGATGITGRRAFYSNFGSKVTIAAPGGGVYKNDGSSGEQANPEGFVWSAINDGTKVPGEAVYGGMAGTSQATPHVTGTVALILGAVKEADLSTPSPAQIRTLLTGTARHFPITPDQLIGAGIVDAAAAVNQALGHGGEETMIPLVRGVAATGLYGASGDSKLFTLELPAGAKNLNLRSMGGTGDVTMLVKAGSAPKADGSDADFSSARAGNAEVVVISKPQAITYYVRIVGVTDFAGVSVLGSYSQP